MDLAIGFPTPEEFSQIEKMAEMLVPSGLLPAAIKTKGQAAAILFTGRELGFPPMYSIRHINSIHGTIGLSAECMRVMVLQAGHGLEFVETTEKLCKMRATRDDKVTEYTYTIQMGAKLSKKVNGQWKSAVDTHFWRQDPAAQLRARCSTAICRMVFPDVIGGFCSREELEDMGEEVKDVDVDIVEPAYSLGAPFPPQPPAEVPEGDEFSSISAQWAWGHLYELVGSGVPEQYYADIMLDVKPGSSVEDIGEAFVRARGFHRDVAPKIAGIRSRIKKISEANNTNGAIEITIMNALESQDLMNLEDWGTVLAEVTALAGKAEPQDKEEEKPQEKEEQQSEQPSMPELLQDIRTMSKELGSGALQRAKEEAGVTTATMTQEEAEHIHRTLKNQTAAGGKGR